MQQAKNQLGAVKTAGYGVANINLKTPATPETVYKIASVSKQFVATGIMLLAEDGRLAVVPVAGAEVVAMVGVVELGHRHLGRVLRRVTP